MRSELQLLGAVESRNHIPFEIAVHNREEDLEEQVDGIYQHGEEV